MSTGRSSARPVPNLAPVDELAEKAGSGRLAGNRRGRPHRGQSTRFPADSSPASTLFPHWHRTEIVMVTFLEKKLSCS